MKIIKRKTTYQLNTKAVDAISEEVNSFLEQIGTERKNILRLKLTIEDMLLVWMNHFGEGVKISFGTGSRFGKPYITLTLEGNEFNPIEENDDFGMVTSHLFAGLGLYPTFEYNKGVNTISFKLKKRQSNPVAGLLTALLAAVIIGLLGMIGPESIRLSINETLLNPVYDAFIGVLTTIAGPMVFLSVAWGVYGIGDASMLGKIGKKMLIRYVALTFCIVSLAIGILVPVSRLSFISAAVDSSGIKDLIELILGIFPKNIVSPFLDGNTIQIIIIAATVGCIMLVLGNQTKTVASFIEEINYIIQHLIELVGSTVPFFIFIIVLRLMWSDSLIKLKTAWLPIVSYLSIAIIFTVLVFIYISIKEKVNFGLLVKKVFPSFLVGLTTASSSAAFGTTAACCDYDLGVKSKITNFGLPLSMVLYKPATAISLVAYSIYFVKEYNVSISPVWIATTIVVVSILTIALVPIPGGAVACYTFLFMHIGVPLEALGIAMVLDIIADFTSTGLNIVLRECELILVAEKVGMLHKSKLQKLRKTK